MDSYVDGSAILLDVLDDHLNLKFLHAAEENVSRSVIRKKNVTKKEVVIDDYLKNDKVMVLPRYRTKLSTHRILQEFNTVSTGLFWRKVKLRVDAILTASMKSQIDFNQRKTLFMYGIDNGDDPAFTYDCNNSDELNMFVEHRLVTFPTDFDILKNCSNVFLRWYKMMCLEHIRDFDELQVTSMIQKNTVAMMQMSNLALCLAADYMNLNGIKLDGVFFSIETLLLVALKTRMLSMDELNITSMFNAVASLDSGFINDLLNVRQYVDRTDVWLEALICDDGSGQYFKILIKSTKMDESYSISLDEDHSLSLSLSDWTSYNSVIMKAVLDEDHDTIREAFVNIGRQLNVSYLLYTEITLRRARLALRRSRLREFALLEALLVDMFATNSNLD